MTILRALAVLLVAIAAQGAATANATTVAFSDDNRTLIVDGDDNAKHEIQFRLSADQASDVVIDTAGFTEIPAACTYSDSTMISCPAHDEVAVVLGPGNDTVNFEADCFAGYDVDLGDGANTVLLGKMTLCPQDVPVEVVSGSGPDSLTAGSQGPVTFFSGGGDDDVRGGAGGDVLHGGEGADRLFGYEGDDQLLGEGGADAPNGGPGNDIVDGGTGDDALELCWKCAGGASNDAGVGADTYVGGPGADALWLTSHPGGIAITLDGSANDGNQGEGDNVGGDIEEIQGTNGNDVFTGGAGDDKFVGNGGDDTLHGGPGADQLIGSGGNDKVYGDAGNDKLEGQQDVDTVDGGPGTDLMYGDIAGCSVFCEPDVDVMLARDGERDSVNCGGVGSAVVDELDVVGRCLTVDRKAVERLDPKPELDPFPPTLKLRAIKPPARARALAKGFEVGYDSSMGGPLKLIVSVPAKLARTLRLKSPVVARATLKLSAAGKGRVRLRFTKDARRRLARGKATTLTVRASLGATHATTKVTLPAFRR